MKVLLIEPNHSPRSHNIADTLEAMQDIVGGPIQAVYPFEEPVALICSEEAKLEGLPPNRALRDEDGNVYDIICGAFFLCAAPPDSEHFESLTDEQIARYTQVYRRPELFLRMGEELFAIPMEAD